MGLCRCPLEVFHFRTKSSSVNSEFCSEPDTATKRRCFPVFDRLVIMPVSDQTRSRIGDVGCEITTVVSFRGTFVAFQQRLSFRWNHAERMRGGM